MDEVECVVIGAGVIGLAIARALAQVGREVIVVESEATIGTHTSSRNSEVIHAGIYYAPGSLMARMCVEGRQALYEYCLSRGVPFRQCGKLIVAADRDEVDRLEQIARRARQNGVYDLAFLSRSEATSMEPDLRCAAALLSPATGIVDSHSLMLSYQGEAEDAGAIIAFNCPLLRTSIERAGFRLSMGGVSPTELNARYLINAAGLFASDVALGIDNFPKEHVPKPYYARGTYFSLSGRSPFSRLIYPIPAPGGLGTHLTLDLGGQARFGPDVEWIDQIDYSVDSSRLPRFCEAIRRYWPGLDETRLHAGYAGIRPKIVPPGAPPQDFVVQGSAVHGVGGLINLFGIESPGLTASLALAAHVRALVDDDTLKR